MPKLIGISGKKRHGKDTLARIIADNLPGHRVAIVSMADALKEEVADFLRWFTLFLVPRKRMIQFVHDHKTWFWLRRLLQWWGTDYRRKQDVDYWVKKMHAKLHGELKAFSVVIIPDIRFKNELDLITRHKGTSIRVWRPAVLNTDSHPSETALDHEKFDFVLMNRNTISYFAADALRFTRKTLWQRIPPK